MSLRRGIFSILIVLHLFVVAVLPNQLSWISRWARPVFEPYIQLFEFSGNWNFFAPDPGPPPFRLEWEREGEMGESLGAGSFPDEHVTYFFTDRFNRRMALARFMALHPEVYVQTGPRFGCGSDPRPHSLRLWQTTFKVPSLEEVASGAFRILEPEIEERRSLGQVFCSRTRRL